MSNVVSNDLAVQVRVEPSLDTIAARFHLTELQVKQIGSGAINRSLPTIRSRFVKLIAAQINMRQADIRPLLLLKKANYERLSGAVTISRKQISLMKFIGTRETPEGVRVQVRKGRSELLKGTFEATMHNPTSDGVGADHIGVFERASHLPTKGPHEHERNMAGGPKYRLIPDREYRAAGRFAIMERFGLTLTGYLTNAAAQLEQMQTDAGDVLGKNIASQLKRRLAEKPK